MHRYARLVVSGLFAIILVSIMILIVGLDNIVSMFILVSTNPTYLVLFLSAFFGAFLFRAKRLQILIGKDNIPYRFYLNIIFVSWFLNVILPARIGEGAQIALLNTEHKVPVGKAAASIVTDKLFDLSALLMLFSVFLFIVGIDLQQEPTLAFFIFISMIVILAILTGLILIAVVPDKIMWLVRMIFGRWERLAAVFCRLIESASLAIVTISKSKSKLLLLFLISLPVWLLEASTLFFVANAVGYNFPLIDTMTATISAFLSMTVPITPGGFGTYELVMAFVLSLLVTQATFDSVALPIAITEHLLRQIVTLIIGVVATSIIGTKFGGLVDMARKYRNFTVTKEANEEDEEQEELSS